MGFGSLAGEAATVGMGALSGASVHDWKFSGKSHAEAERKEGCDGRGHVRNLDVA